MSKIKCSITDSTKLTMIFCGCVVAFSAILLVFLMFFPLKVEDPANGINEKLIASGKATTVTTTNITTTASSFINTRQTTDKNHITTTTFTETVNDNYEYNDDYYDYNDFDYNDYDTPIYTQPPVITDFLTSDPVVTNIPDTSDTFSEPDNTPNE